MSPQVLPLAALLELPPFYLQLISLLLLLSFNQPAPNGAADEPPGEGR
jgi:hypothetical protein